MKTKSIVLFGAFMALAALAGLTIYLRGNLGQQRGPQPSAAPPGFSWYSFLDEQGATFFFAVPSRFGVDRAGTKDEANFRAGSSETLSIAVGSSVPAQVLEAFSKERLEPGRKTEKTGAGAEFSVRIFGPGVPTLPIFDEPREPEAMVAVAFWSWRDAAAAVELSSKASVEKIEAEVIAIARTLTYVKAKKDAEVTSRQLDAVGISNRG